jgi:lipopolysaccharide biosynthesis glycosyltransferase
MNAVIVTAANETYAALLRDLLDSLEPHRASLKSAVACLDLGLSEQTRADIATRVEHLVVPQWPFRPHARFDSDRRHLSRAARPFLPDLLPGYAIYVWLDADTWVQQAQGIRWLIDAARTADIAAVPTVHRMYSFADRDIAWLFERYRMALGEGLARELVHLPYVNAGVMALRAGSPLWRGYAQRFQTALDNWQGAFLSDQAILNAAIHLDGMNLQRLPAKTNWLCHLARPVWNDQTRLLAEPALPFDPILIVHNTFDDKHARGPIEVLSGQPRRTRLTFSAIKSLGDHSQVV